MLSSPLRARRSLIVATCIVAIATMQVLTPAAASASSAGGTGTATPPKGSVDVLRADATQVKAELTAIAGRRTAAEAKLALARTAAAEANAALAAAKKVEAAAARRAAVMNTRVRRAAVKAYIGNGTPVPMAALLTDNADEASWQSTVLEYRADQLKQLLDRQKAAQRQLATERAASAAKAREAQDAQEQTQAEVDKLVQLENHQQDVVNQVNDRLDAALAEAAALAEVNRKAAAKLAKEEQALRDAAAQAALVSNPAPSGPKAPATKSPSTPTTTTPKSSPTTTTPNPGPGTTIPVPVITRVDTVSVNGIVVARSIADELAAMMAAAKSAGLTLGGSGYRDINTQIQLRIAHCGSSDYAIWYMPASQCSPPTAIPGRSMHEKGLAIDFTCSRSLIDDHNDPCFIWLDQNAASFGFYNLPSEPWHWSTTGS